jgi:lipoate-protein ligase A
MAVDSALLEGAAAGVGAFRWYRWSRPTLSLGYFQSVRERNQHAPSRGCPLVRRMSGGGAIVHDRELTYSLVVPIGSRWGGSADHMYRRIHTTLVAALARQSVAAHLLPAVGPAAKSSTLEPFAMPRVPNDRPQPSGAVGISIDANGSPDDRSGSRGTGEAGGPRPFLCFQRRARGDVMIGPVKVAGSAQRRWHGALLQHGSILWERSECAPELAGIADLAGHRVDALQFQSDWLELLPAALQCDWQAAEYSAAQLARAGQIEREQFGADAWNQRR